MAKPAPRPTPKPVARPAPKPPARNYDPVRGFVANVVQQLLTPKLVSPLPKTGYRTVTTPGRQVIQMKPGTLRTTVVPGTPPNLVPVIHDAAVSHNIPPYTLAAVAKHESGGTFNPQMREYDPNGKGRGMFQIDLGQHPNISQSQAFDPNFSSNYAAGLLQEGKNATGSVHNALRYYNGGPGYNSPRQGYGGNSVAQNTNRYVSQVEAIPPLPTAVPTTYPQATTLPATTRRAFSWNIPNPPQQSMPTTNRTSSGLVSPVPLPANSPYQQPTNHDPALAFVKNMFGHLFG